MSQQAKLRQSRPQWKHKAGRRAEQNRYLRKQLARVKKERERSNKALKEAQARLRQQETRSRELAGQHKVDLVLLALQLFVVARIGFRAGSRALSILAEALGLQKAPCPQTVINWVRQLSLVRLQGARTLRGLPLSQAPFTTGWIWMIDISLALGTGKILAVLALDAHHHQLARAAPGFQHVHGLAVSVAASWTGDTIAALLQRVIAVMGRPAAYLKDGGNDLQKAIRLLAEQGLASPTIDDISHVVAKLLKRQYQAHPMFATFVSACGRVSDKLKQTILACLAPPKVHTKARFMNVHPLVTWADRVLKLSPAGRAAKGSTLSTLRAGLDQLPSGKAFIKRFRDDAVPLLACPQILKTQGLTHDTLAQGQPLIDTVCSAAVRRAFATYLQGQLETAATLGLDTIGLPISSDQMESLFGLAKPHGAGDIQDANRLALRLPALCGSPTRVEAKQVLESSVAAQNKITRGFTSLTTQRREVLSNPDTLERLGMDQAHNPVELLPSSTTRSKHQEISHISNGYKNPYGPQPHGSEGHPRLASTAP